jgi:thioredoxin-like negative regulator of GroEL
VQKTADRPRCGKCKTPLRISIATRDRPLIVSDKNFTGTVLRSPLPFLVDFHSPDCGPCKLLAPTITRTARDFQGRLQVGTLNVEINQYIPSLYRIGATPTLVLFQSGREVGRLEGYQPAAALLQLVRPYAW